jgi:hypothetical protein
MIGAYLTESITIRYLTALDEWNTATYTDVAAKARVEWRDKLIRNAKGEQIISAALVYLAGEITPITNADRIVIAGIEHAILRVDKIADFSVSHFEIWIQ